MPALVGRQYLVAEGRVMQKYQTRRSKIGLSYITDLIVVLLWITD